MGRETRNFRQAGRSRAANTSGNNRAGINRTGHWGKIVNFFKKGGYYGQS